MATSLHIAMLSVHSSPLGSLGTSDTGGMSIYLLELAIELGKSGNRVDIFTRQMKGIEEVVDYAKNVRIISLSLEGLDNLVRSQLFEHLHRFTQAILSHQDANTYDIIHSNYWLSGVVGEQLKAIWGCPHVITFHTIGFVKMIALPGHREEQLRLDNEAQLMQNCEGIIVPTMAEAHHLATMQSKSSAPVHIIAWGVNRDLFKVDILSKNRPERPSSHPLVLFVGRFDPMKGIEHVLRSFCAISSPEVHLAIIGGDGPGSQSFQKIEEYVQQHGLQHRVHLLGAVEHRHMAHHYQRADVVVISSYYESFGLVILEALASGTPVVSTPVGIAPYVIEPGTNGYITAVNDHQSLKEAVTMALELAKNCNAWKISESVKEYGWSKVAISLVDVYNGTIYNV